MRILDIGCGRSKYAPADPGDTVVGMDCSRQAGVDVVHNLEDFPWPFSDDEFELVVAHHILEHLSDLVATMEEIWRVAKPGASVRITVPYFSFPGAFQDPTHKRFFTWKTFDYFLAGVEFNYYSRARFEMGARRLSAFAKHRRLSALFDPAINCCPKFYERFFAYIFPAEELRLELRVVKGKFL